MPQRNQDRLADRLEIAKIEEWTTFRQNEMISLRPFSVRSQWSCPPGDVDPVECEWLSMNKRSGKLHNLLMFFSADEIFFRA